jgi:hypothetical protein
MLFRLYKPWKKNIKNRNCNLFDDGFNITLNDFFNF